MAIDDMSHLLSSACPLYDGPQDLMLLELADLLRLWLRHDDFFHHIDWCNFLTVNFYRLIRGKADIAQESNPIEKLRIESDLESNLLHALFSITKWQGRN